MRGRATLTGVSLPVALIVNVYERTYRPTLQAGQFTQIEQANRVVFDERWALINNVDDRHDAERRAVAMVETGELTGFRFVSDVIDDALRAARLPRRVLRNRGYFLDFGLAMGVTGSSPYVLGWDAETKLVAAYDWLTPAVEMLAADSDVFSAAPRWPAHRDTLDEESVAERGPWALNYGFSDQVFLVRRSEIASPIYRSFAPASLARSANHPFTFEARLESFQRATSRMRATHTVARYDTNDMDDVIVRTGGYSFGERIRNKVLNKTRGVLLRAKLSSPRFRLP
jgi:hypothetical protein